MAKVLSAMLGNSDLSEFGEKKVNRLNQSKRLPAIILVDTSGSMSDYEELLRKAVESLYDEILKDNTAKNATELAVMTFNSEIEVLERMREVKQQESNGRGLNFHCDGVTLTGLAVKAAIKQIENRKDVYKSTKVKYYPPILFLLSDGYPYCGRNPDPKIQSAEDAAMKYCKQYIRQEVSSNSLVVIAVEVGDSCDHNLMRELTGLNDERHLLKVNDSTELANFFKFTSDVIIKSSTGSIKNLNAMSIEDMKK